MRTTLAILLIIIAFGAYAQKNQAAKKIQLSITASPDISYRWLKSNYEIGINSCIMNARNEYEKYKLGYTVGFNVTYYFTPHFGLESGLHFSDQGYRERYVIFEADEPHDPAFPYETRSNYHFQYLELPVMARFTIGKKKVRFTTSLGLTTQYLLRGIYVIRGFYDDHSDEETCPVFYDFSRINLSPSISAGVDFKINDRMNLRFEPSFKFGVLKINNEPVTDYLYRAGVNISFAYGF